MKAPIQMAEMIQSKRTPIVARKPPLITHILGAIAFATFLQIREPGVEGMLAAVGGEVLDIGVLGDGTADVVTDQAGANKVRIERVQEIMLLIRERRARRCEIALGCKGQELRRASHDGNKGAVEVRLHLPYKAAELGFQLRDLDEGGGRGIDGEKVAADGGETDDGVLDELEARAEGFLGLGGFGDGFVEEVADVEAQPGRDGEDAREGDEDVGDEEVGVVGGVEELDDFFDVEAGEGEGAADGEVPGSEVLVDGYGKVRNEDLVRRGFFLLVMDEMGTHTVDVVGDIPHPRILIGLHRWWSTRRDLDARAVQFRPPDLSQKA